MSRINTYLSFNGNAAEAFNFYKSAIGGEFERIQYFRDLPDHQVTEAEKNRIMHVALPVGDNLLMGCDTSEAFGNTVRMGSNFSISFSADSKDHADRLFSSLSEGGKISMPMNDTFWGAYFGMLIDKFGINWMIDFDYAK